MVRSVLEKVDVVGDTLIITFSLLQLGHTIGISILFLLVAIGIVLFLINNPNYGLGFIG